MTDALIIVNNLVSGGSILIILGYVQYGGTCKCVICNVVVGLL